LARGTGAEVEYFALAFVEFAYADFLRLAMAAARADE
jgi:hypothetical protein